MLPLEQEIKHEPFTDQGFHVGLKAFIEHENKVLILRSNPQGFYANSFWGMPGGRINTEELEDPFETTLAREIREELGEAFKVSIGSFFHAWKFIRPSKMPILLLGIHCKYRSGPIVLSPEFDTYAWIEKEQAGQYKFLPGHAEAIQRWSETRQLAKI
jgi:8-oxo-dGTP pyrophosphatase MutT (NUDIX family)